MRPHFGKNTKKKITAPAKKPAAITATARSARAHQEHVPNCMRPLINKKIRLLSELTEHTIANEIEAPAEVTVNRDLSL